ncbi:hypothetical protein Pelo_11751 [Pelomyxa schiedti]|nr:hypothetical protein Pelo_11751 [Pelomyxa schiedti]
MSSTATRIPVSDQVRSVWREQTQLMNVPSTQIRAIKVVIQNEVLVLGSTLEQSSSIETDFNKLSGVVSGTAPCYVLFKKTSTSWIFVLYVPEGARTQEKLVYAATVAPLKSQLGATNFTEELHFGQPQDFNWASHTAAKQQQKCFSKREKHLMELDKMEETARNEQEEAHRETVSRARALPSIPNKSSPVSRTSPSSTASTSPASTRPTANASPSTLTDTTTPSSTITSSTPTEPLPTEKPEAAVSSESPQTSIIESTPVTTATQSEEQFNAQTEPDITTNHSTETITTNSSSSTPTAHSPAHSPSPSPSPSPSTSTSPSTTKVTVKPSATKSTSTIIRPTPTGKLGTGPSFSPTTGVKQNYNRSNASSVSSLCASFESGSPNAVESTNQSRNLGPASSQTHGLSTPERRQDEHIKVDGIGGYHAVKLPIAPNVTQAFSMYQEGSINFIELRILTQPSEVIEASNTSTCTFTELPQRISQQEPRFYLFKHNQSGGVIQNLFIYCCPDKSPPRLRMVYSTVKPTAVSAVTQNGISLSKTMEIREGSEVTSHRVSEVFSPPPASYYGQRTLPAARTTRTTVTTPHPVYSMMNDNTGSMGGLHGKKIVLPPQGAWC